MSADTMPDVPAEAVVAFVNSLPDWEEVSRGSRLKLPIAGREYVIPHASYSTAAALAGGGESAWSDEEFLSRMLGDELERMRTDDVPKAAITHAAFVAHADATKGRDVALAMWRYGMDPDALQAAIEKNAAAQDAETASKKTAAKSARKPARKR